MLHNNHENSSSRKNVKKKNMSGKRRFMGCVLFTISTILIACGNKGILSETSPARSESEYYKNNMAGPTVNVVNADTYRVCDVGGCTYSVTKKTPAYKPKVNYRDKRTNLARLKSPVLPVSKMSLKKHAVRPHIRRHMNISVNGKRGSRFRALRANGKSHLRANTKLIFSEITNKEKSRLTGRMGLKANVETAKRPKLRNIIGVRFKYNDSSLSKTEKEKLNVLVSRIRKAKSLYIAGYIDNRSQLPKSHQKLLASKRAIAIARYFKMRGINVSKLKVGAYGKCCFGSLNDLKGINQYYRRAEVYFNRKLLLRHARIKRPSKLLSDRRINVNRIWN